MKIVLFGMKGCGKTTLGRLLAARKEWSFFDTDLILEKLFISRYQMQKNCSEIYRYLGQYSFRDLETEVIQSLLEKENAVIALGGGALLLDKNVALLKETFLIYLSMDREVLKKRILRFFPPPVWIDPRYPDRSFNHMYYLRHERYQNLAKQIVDLTNLTPDKGMEALWEKIENGQ